MSTPTPTTPATNGPLAPAPMQNVVVLSESDYRKLVAERDELLVQMRETAEKHKLIVDYYRHVHHLYYELVKDKLPPEDPDWTPPPPEDAVDMREFLAQLEREYGSK